MSKDNGTSRTLQRIISGLILVFFFLFMRTRAMPRHAYTLTLLYVVPVFCIWFPDWMGENRGFLLSYRWRITGGSPPSLVAILGWVVLLSGPLFFWLVCQWWGT